MFCSSLSSISIHWSNFQDKSISREMWILCINSHTKYKKTTSGIQSLSFYKVEKTTTGPHLETSHNNNYVTATISRLDEEGSKPHSTSTYLWRKRPSPGCERGGPTNPSFIDRAVSRPPPRFTPRENAVAADSARFDLWTLEGYDLDIPVDKGARRRR